MQQKTVRSLQEAIRNPIPKEQYGPTPTLPPQFEDREERNVSAYIEEEPLVQIGGIGGQFVGDRSQETLGDGSDEQSVTQLWYAYIAQNLPEGNSIPFPDTNVASKTRTITTRENLAYLLIINEPSDLCSALLFTKTQEHDTRLSPPAKIVFLYPATWEMSDEASHIEAMDVLRRSQDTYSVTLHPVTMSRVWAGVEVESQLLAEIQLTRWTYDRAMFVRPGGMVVDTWKMDRVLALSDTRNSWRSLPPTYRTSSRPELLMYVNGLGLRAPMHDIKGTVARVVPGNTVTADMRNAAYVVLNSRLNGALGQRFDMDIREVCAGTRLLDNGNS